MKRTLTITSYVIIALASLWGAYKIITHDFCPLYYGEPCLITNK